MKINIPTVKLVNKVTGEKKIINRSEFDPKTMKDWVKATGSVPETPKAGASAPESITTLVKEAAEATEKPAKDDVDPNWRDMPWPKRRGYIRGLTGEFPKTIEESESIMADYMSR